MSPLAPVLAPKLLVALAWGGLSYGERGPHCHFTPNCGGS